MLIYLLYAPFYVEINSLTGLCRMRFHHIASAGLEVKDRSLKLVLKITWWRTEMDLLTKREPRKKKEVSRKPKNKGWKLSVRKIRKVLAGFKLNQCSITIDTGNQQINGILLPLFLRLSRVTGKKIQISFHGENEIILQMENNLARIVWAFIISKS